MYEKYLKDACVDKYQAIWTIPYQGISADLEKIIKRKIFCCTCLKNGRAQWIMKKYLNFCLQTYLKRLTAFLMNF